MADDPKPGILRSLRIKRVALVEMGANFDKRTGDGAHIMLWKSAEQVAAPEDSDYESEYEKSNLDAESRNALPDSAFAAVWTDAKGKKHRKLPIHDAGHLAAARGRIGQADIPASVKAEAQRKIDAATKHKEKAVKKSLFQRFIKAVSEPDATKRSAELSEIEKAFPPDDNDADDKIHKADDPMCKCDACMAKRAPADVTKSAEFVAMQKRVEASEAVNADLRKSIDAMEKAQAEGEVREILKSFKATAFVLTGEGNDVEKYTKLRKSDRAMFDTVIDTFRKQDNVLAASNAFSNNGSGRIGKSSAWSQIEAKATEMRKSDKNLTKDQAIEQVILDPDNAALVKTYRAEQQ